MEEFYDKTNEDTEAPAPKGGRTLDRPKTMAYSVASLLLSLMSLVCCCTGAISMLFGILAVVFAILSRRHLGYFDTMALIGLIVGIVGAVFGAFAFILDLLSATEGFEGIDIRSDFGVSF